MTTPRMVQCIKLGHEAEGMARPPFPNELGKKLFDDVSKEAWKLWLAHSTMLINEYRIDLQSKEGTKFLLEQCEKFFYGGEVAQASGYVPPGEAKKDAHGRSASDPHYGHDHAHGEPHDHGEAKKDAHGRSASDPHYGHDHAHGEPHDHGHDHGHGHDHDHGHEKK